MRLYYNPLAWIIASLAFWQILEKPANKAQQALNAPLQSPRTLIRQIGTPVIFGYSPCFVPPPKDCPADRHVTGYWFLNSQKNDRQPLTALLDLSAETPAEAIKAAVITRQLVAQNAAASRISVQLIDVIPKKVTGKAPLVMAYLGA